MLTVIGLIFCVLITIIITIVPFLIVEVSENGAGLNYKIVLFCLFLLCLAAFGWANIFSIVDITIKVGDL